MSAYNPSIKAAISAWLTVGLAAPTYTKVALKRCSPGIQIKYPPVSHFLLHPPSNYSRKPSWGGDELMAWAMVGGNLIVVSSWLIYGGGEGGCAQ